MGCYVCSCLKSLRSLKLGGGRFTNKGLRVLTGLTSLRSLSLVNCYNITDKGFKALVAPLSKQSLAQVDVRGCGLTDLSLVSPKQRTGCTHIKRCRHSCGKRT